MARFSEAFLVLRAQDVGLAIAWVPAVMIAMNVVYAAVAAPVGALSDHLDRRRLLTLGMGVLVLADLAAFRGCRRTKSQDAPTLRLFCTSDEAALPRRWWQKR